MGTHKQYWLYPANENYVVDAQATPKEAKNNADGSFVFDALTFEEIGTYYFVIGEDADTEEDIGKTYTYKLTEVNGGKANVSYSTAEYTITVAIELNANNELVATLTKNGENTLAVVAEFENVYNYTPTPPIPEYPDSPQTGDATNLHLWFALLFVSGGGVIGTTLYSRKRKEEN